MSLKPADVKMKNIETIPQYFEKTNQGFDWLMIRCRQLKNWARRMHIKFFNWEYWPMWLVYLPSFFYFVYLSLKARSCCFFSVANPSIETGGMIFESKWDIFKLIPKEYYPSTILITANENTDTVIISMNNAGIGFPAIAKPDRGERGWCVAILQNKKDLQNYITRHPIDFLVQQYIGYPVELSVFYYRHPGSANGIITSVTGKEYLSVTGDGISNICELIKANDRAFLQMENLRLSGNINFNRFLHKGEKMVLAPFGNHTRGAMFLDYCSIIDDELTATFNKMSKQIEGFYFGRFDLKCKSIDDLKKGHHFLVLELNGAGAEPSHIYQPGFSFIKAQQVITSHYKMMYLAAKANHKKGIPFMSLQSFAAVRAAERKHKQKIK